MISVFFFVGGYGLCNDYAFFRQFLYFYSNL